MGQEFSDEEVKWLRFLESRYDSGPLVPISELPDYDESNRDAVFRRIEKFRHLGLVDFGIRNSLEIQPMLLHALREYDNQPPPDYWQRLVVWWRRRKWAVALTVLFAVILPLVVSIVALLKSFELI